MTKKRKASIEKLFQAKKERRMELARLPFDKKILILIKLQELASSVGKEFRGIKKRPWKI